MDPVAVLLAQIRALPAAQQHALLRQLHDLLFSPVYGPAPPLP